MNLKRVVKFVVAAFLLWLAARLFLAIASQSSDMGCGMAADWADPVKWVWEFIGLCWLPL